MKKVLSLILVVALFASLAICASAAGKAPFYVTHSMHTDEQVFGEIEHDEQLYIGSNQDGWWLYTSDGCYSWDGVRMNPDNCQIISKNFTDSFTSCNGQGGTVPALSVKELKDLVLPEELEGKSLTVFRQRNITGITDDCANANMTAKLWCGNTWNKKNQAIVIAEYVNDAWQVVGYTDHNSPDTTSGSDVYNTCTVSLTEGASAYAVLLAW